MTAPEYEIEDIILALIDESLADEHYEAIKTVHNAVAGHEGVDRTLEKLKAMGKSWPYMRSHVKKFIRECPCCQLNSQRHFQVKQHPYAVSTYHPMERLNVDFIGPFPDNGYVLVVIDTFTRWLELFATADATAISAAEALLQHFGRFGLPSQLLSDRGSHFIAGVISELTALVGIDHPLTIAFSKEENGIVERANKEANRHVRNLLFDKRITDEYRKALPFTQRIYNSAPLGRTKIAPAELLFGKMVSLDRQIFLPPGEREETADSENLSDYMTTLVKIQDDLIDIHRKLLRETDDERLQKYNEGQTEFAIDSFVLMVRPTGPPSRLATVLKGPYKVIKRNRKGTTYTIQDLVRMNTKEVSVHLLRPFIYDSDRIDPRQVANQNESVFDVEEILAHKGQPKRVTNLRFQVKWRGYDDPKDYTWEPWKELRNNAKLHDYLRKIGWKQIIPAKFKRTQENV